MITTLMFNFFLEDCLLENSNLWKRLKRLITLARPERFELPTTWFEARYSNAHFNLQI